MLNEIKTLLGDAAANYTDAQIELYYQMALAEIEEYCKREVDKTLEIICIGNCCNECDNDCSNFRILPKTIIYNNNSYTVTRSNSHWFKGFSSWNIVILPNFIINLLLVLIILLILLVIV